MRRICSLGLAVLWAAAFFALPYPARADTVLTPGDVNLQYGHGRLLQNVQVSTVFVGSWWNDGSDLHDYLNQFFTDLFADGHYMANLAQYSAGPYQIGNGAMVGSYTHAVDLPSRITDTQIEAELRGLLTAGLLPRPEPDSLYVVFTPPDVLVHAGSIGDSVQVTASGRTGWFGYHSYFRNPQGGWSAYAVVPYDEVYWYGDLFPEFVGDPHLMTSTTSHELAEAVTDPFPTNSSWGWADPQFKDGDEIGDIPETLYGEAWQAASDAGLPAPDPSYVWVWAQGLSAHPYLVQKVWSMQDGYPVAFAAGTGPDRGAAQRSGTGRSAPENARTLSPFRQGIASQTLTRELVAP